MDHLLFCVNHQEKIAKRHCNKCDQDLCNECVFDSHVEHHEEVKKIEYTIDTKKTNFSEMLSKDIKLIVEKSLNDLKPKIYKLVLEKTQEYIKDHKNLQLKLNQPTEKKAINKPIKIETKTKPIKHTNYQENKENRESLKKNIITTSNTSNISQRAKMFNTQNSREIPKVLDKNNPYNKGNFGGIKAKAKLFEQK
jgi:hypothetical protein